MPYLAQIQEAEGIVVQITERIGNLAVAVYSAQRLAEDITKAHYGYHFPLHAGSKGQVLLAYEDPAFIDAYLRRDLERMTGETITDPAVLRAELAKIRQAGMALTVADVQPFTGSMAAPIRDGSGKVLASLCFIFRKVLLRNEKRREELQDQLMHMAHSISIDLGWRRTRGERRPVMRLRARAGRAPSRGSSIAAPHRPGSTPRGFASSPRMTRFTSAPDTTPANCGRFPRARRRWRR